MSSPVLTEKPAPLTFVVSEQEGPYYTRETGNLAPNKEVVPGELLGQLTASKQYVPHNPAGADGSETVVAIAGYPAKSGATPVPFLVWVGPGEVRGSDLIYPAGISANDRAAALVDLRTKGIKVR